MIKSEFKNLKVGDVVYLPRQNPEPCVVSEVGSGVMWGVPIQYIRVNPWGYMFYDAFYTKKEAKMNHIVLEHFRRKCLYDKR